LRAAGVDVDVVSGLTSGLAGPTAIGVPVTDRRHAPGVAFVTGHSGDGATAPDWPALVQSRLTLVIYMGVSHSAKLQQALLDAGMRPTMPCAVITQACTPRQRHACMPLRHLASVIEQERIGSPAIIVVGNVVSAVQAIGCAWPTQASAQAG
jgi:uroporphyrin-III C-methyltransferase